MSNRVLKCLCHHEQVVVIGPSNPELSMCFACQLKEYAQAEILVGLHGAGLTNLVFMPTGSLLVEIVGKFDGRMLPWCGYHGPLAAMYGVHHYLHYYDWKGREDLDPVTMAQSSKEFYQHLKQRQKKKVLV